MATRTKSGLLPILLIVGAFVFFGDKILDSAQAVLDDITGRTDGDYAVASSAKLRVRECTTDQILKEKQCNDLKILVIDAAKMPFIARNIQLAWSDGKEAVLHRDAPANRQPHYNAVCGSKSAFTARYPGFGSCDEYPFASTQEGGAGARTEEVPGREQSCQGATVRNAYYNPPGIEIGEEFLVVISHPDQIAKGPFEGVDIAKERACGI